jgi:hypothetical protein
MADLSAYRQSLLILGVMFVIAAFLTNRVLVPRGKKDTYIPEYKIGFQRSVFTWTSLAPLRMDYVNKQLWRMVWPTFWLLMLFSVAQQNGYLLFPGLADEARVVAAEQAPMAWHALVVWLLAWIFGSIIVAGSSYRAVEEGPGGDPEVLAALRSRIGRLSPEEQRRVAGAYLPDVRGFARRANRAILPATVLTSIGVMGLIALGIWVSRLAALWATVAVVGVFLLDLLLYFGVVFAEY